MDSKEKAYSEWLVIRCQQGSRQALRPLLGLWQGRYLAYARNRLGDADAAQDAVQDGLLAICRTLYKLEDPASFGRWSFTIIERRCIDLLRRRYRDRALFEAQNSAREPGAEDRIDMDSKRLLAQLPAELAALLRLYYLEDMKLDEIAQIQAIPQGTVKSRLYYARKKLQKLLEVQDEKSG